jgi:O-antigen chain-terminating methyltransferase
MAHEEILVRQVNHIGQSLLNEARSVWVSQQQILQQMKEESARLLSEQANNHDVLLARISEFTAFLEERINDEAAQRQDELRHLQSDLQATSSQQREEAKNELGKVREQLFAELHEFEQKERRTAAELALQSLQLSRMNNQTTVEQTEINGGQLGFGTDSHLLDAFFASFDEQFRGDRDTIKDRLRVYLPFLPVGDDVTILDVGSGRGEWLELLHDAGFKATGVELNSSLVSSCRERGLEVREQNLFTYLNSLPERSLSVLSAFHVVEHFPVEQVVLFLSEAMRVLRPAGVLILETPNPRNVLVGSCNFYFDPTHRNPLPSEVLKLMVETKGFERIEVLPLNPSDAMPVPGDSEIVNRFNEYFYGPMDYGLIARRP